MAKMLSYPHFVINVEDQSKYDEYVSDDLECLHVPMLFGRYAKGPINKPIWVTRATINRIFGKEWSDTLTNYFTHESLFIEKALSGQGVFIVNLKSEDCMTANILVTATVTKGINVVQYERDEYGNRILDENGDPIPKLSEANQPIMEPGIKIKWSVRTLDPETEKHVTDVRPVTEDGEEEGSTVTTYPILAAVAKYPGVSGDNLGFRFYFNLDEQQDDRLSDNKALEYSFSPVELDYSDNNPSVIRNTWNQIYSTFMLKPKQFDSKVMQNISCDEVLASNYPTDTDNELPFTFYTYTDYIKEIGQMVIDVETNDLTLTDPYLVNIFSLINLDNTDYHHVESDPDSSIFFNSNYTIYLQNGSDGDTSQDTYEHLIRQFLSLETFPELKDQYRYPITHLYDTGYKNETKEAFIEFLSLRDDVRVELSTQDLTNEINDISEDQSVGLYLRTRALLQPESTLKGTDCCRASIYCHSGTVYDDRYSGYIPLTLDILDKRIKYQSSTYMKGEPKGRPYSEITLFKNLNWVAFDENNKNLFWESGINYIQHFNRTGVFWPDLRTVYTSDTSVLSEWSFVDAIVYAKHIIRKIWTIYTGSTTPVEELFSSIENKVNDYLRKAYNGRYTTRVKAWRNEQDAKLGYLCRLTMYITGRTSMRVFECEIVTFKDETVIAGMTTTEA